MPEHACEKVPCPFCDLRPSIPPGEGRTATIEDLTLMGPAIVHHPDGTVTEHGWEWDEITFGTCDWGDCDEPAVGYRLDPDTQKALPVCPAHIDGDVGG